MKHIVDGLRAAVPRWLAVLVTGALAFTGVVAVSAAPASAASGVQVYVGYADDLRATPANFPTPWAGAPGVTFNGCTGTCSFDAGAVRIVNNTTLTETVNSVTVSLSTCTYDIWNKNVVLAPGQQLIVTQTVSGASNGCDSTSGLFDTSDVGANGAGWAGNCNQSGVIPQINATIDNVLNTFTDSKQVLNTGGVDLASCPSGSNESQQWSLVGTRCPGSTIRLAPAAQTDAVGTNATLTATVANSCGDPLQGVNVTFAVLSGPNAHQQFTTPTNASGVATFTYSSATTGTDTIQALASNPAGTFGSNHATVAWTQRPSTLTIAGGATSSDFNDPATVAATLTDSAGPVVGQPVVFVLNGAETCTGTTNASGSASCSITPQEPNGSYTLTASFAGSTADLASSTSATFTVPLEQTTLTYTGATQATNGQPVTLAGTLQEDGTSPIVGRTVTFTLGSGASAQSCNGTTDSTGSASCTIASATQVPTDTTTPVTAVFAGDAFYQHAAASATVTWLQQPSTLTITGGATTSDFNDAATVAATLTDASGPVAGQPVVFVLNGTETCTGTTNGSGSASCSITPQEAAGSYTLTASFAGSPMDLSSSASSSFAVTLEETTLTYTGPTQATDGQPLTLSGVLQEDGTSPIAGRSVTFTLGSGASAQSCIGATDPTGAASCTIASAHQGPTDTSAPVTATFAGDTFYQPSSASATVKWLQRPTTLTITGGATSSDFNDPATVAATLTDSAGPVVGQPVVFLLNGTETCTGTTNASGSASCSITPREAAGSYTLTASFAGSPMDLGSTASSSFAVTPEETTLTYTGPTKAANGQPLTLSAVLKEDGTSPIAGRSVTFTLGSGASAQSCTGTTDATGTASCTIASVNQPAASTSVGVTAVFAGDTFYQHAAASATVKFQYLTGHAFGLQSSGLVGISPTPDTGAIQTASAATFAPPCVATISGLISAGTLCAKVVTSLNPGTSTANASVQSANIGVLGLPVIKVGAVQSTSTTRCTGATGTASIASISVGGIPVNVALNPAPNTGVNVLGVTLIFNEQTPVAGADQGLTVNAVHIKALGLLDVVIASSTSDIHNC